MASKPPAPPPAAPRAQRAWRAVCPNCGAPVEFSSAASASAVCSFCRSTLLREGEALRRIGESAELFDDHSPLQLGASGRYQNVSFTLVGRLQYRYAAGTWNEWFALFERADGRQRPAWLSEDNGAYVLAFDQPTPAELPTLDKLQPGFRRQVGNAVWSVASVQRASILSAQGELPRPPQPGVEFSVVDLRNEHGEVGTLDFGMPGGAGVQWSVGRSVTLAGLAMQGLREGESEKTLAGRALECPSCGHALAPTLASTQSITCPQCAAVVDISQGVGADLAHFAQNNGGVGSLEPQLPLGRTGRLALGTPEPRPWQVVGYQERCDLPGLDDEDEQAFWREYLLFNRELGFAFLVDAEDGWSAVRPLTGAPVQRDQTVTWLGQRYQQRGAPYRAKVTWVQGEFYWRVQREETATVTDYDGPKGAKLSREQTRDELVWSAGPTLAAKDVAQAFGLNAEQAAALRRDASPMGLSWNVGRLLRLALIVAVLLVIAVVLLRSCTRDDCASTRQVYGEFSAEYQQCQRARRSGGWTGGGSWGGYSSGGGGHK